MSYLEQQMNGGMRSFCTRLIHYGFDVAPLLYLTPEKYLKPEHRKVTAKITLTPALTKAEKGR